MSLCQGVMDGDVAMSDCQDGMLIGDVMTRHQPGR